MNAPFSPDRIDTAPPRAPQVPPGRRRLLRWGALALVLAAGVTLYSRLTAPSPTAGLMTAPVTRGDVEETVLATGTLKPSKLVAVGAQASGRITVVKVRLGDRVKAGDLVAEIDSITQQNELRTAEASLANVRAQKLEKEATLRLNELTLSRQTRMVAQKAISQADFETADADVKVTRAQLAALEAQIVEAEIAVETARANLGYTRITAPIDGTVLSIVAQEGQTVNATQSAPTIVILGRLDVMTVRSEISEADIVKVETGMPLWFSILGAPEQRYDARLQFIEPAPESIKSDSSFSTSSTSSSTSSSSSSSTSSSSAIYYIGLFDVPNPDGRLRTYMTAEVHIILGQAKNVLTLPATALERDGQGQAVRVVGADGTMSRRRVEVGLNDKVTAEVRSGVSEGERVVTGEMTAGATASPMGGPPPMGGL